MSHEFERARSSPLMTHDTWLMTPRGVWFMCLASADGRLGIPSEHEHEHENTSPVRQESLALPAGASPDRVILSRKPGTESWLRRSDLME